MEQNEVYAKVRQLQKKGLTINQIVQAMNDEGTKNAKGGKITKSIVNYVLYKKKSSKPRTKTATQPTRFNATWVRKILTETSLQDKDKINQLRAFLEI